MILVSVALHLLLIGVWQGTPSITLQTGPVVTLRLNPVEPQRLLPDNSSAPPATPQTIAPPAPPPQTQPRPQPVAAAAAINEPHTAAASAAPQAAPVQPSETARPTQQAEITQQTGTAAVISLESARAEILARVRDDIARHFNYPLLARKRGWEGEVRLGLHILANGDIGRIVIAQSSGHALLDRSALETLSRIGQVGGAAAWLQGRSLELTLPVIYRLTSS